MKRSLFSVKCGCGCEGDTARGKKYIRGHYARVNNPMNNLVHRQTCREANQTPEAREKKRIAQLNRPISPETRAKLSIALKGRKTPWTEGENNVMRNPEIKRKHREAVKAAMGPEVTAKAKRTNQERYGVDNFSKTDAFRKMISGEFHPNWKGGLSPERQLVYVSREWQEAAAIVWARDKSCCVRCGIIYNPYSSPLVIHHIIGFENVETRCDLDNLVLLCKDCHYWVHSRKNEAMEYKVAIQT